MIDIRTLRTEDVEIRIAEELQAIVRKSHEKERVHPVDEKSLIWGEGEIQ